MDDLRLPFGRHCTKCGKWKLWEEFHRHSQRRDGRRPDCIECHSLRRRKRRAERGDEMREQARAYYQKNKRRILELAKDHYQGNAQQMRARVREYHKANAKQISKRRKKNIEKQREQLRRWQRNNRERVRMDSRNRRALLFGNRGSFTAEEWQALCEMFGSKCLSCGESGEVKTLTVDHVVPLSKGGINSIENIQPLCGSCNSSKGTRIIDYR